VLDLAVRGLGDVPPLPVGGDPIWRFQPLPHRPEGLAAPVLVPAGVLAAGGLLQVAALAGGDQPVRAGAGQVGLGAVPRIGQRLPDAAAAARVRGGASGRGSVPRSGRRRLRRRIIGPNQAMSVGSSVSSVAMISSSSLVTFSAL
jgi:hypothetical protein